MNPDQKPRTGLLAKLLVAQTAAGNVAKRGENKDQKYSYARAEDVIAEASKALNDAGLVAHMEYGEFASTEITSRNGGRGLSVTLPASLVISDPDSGEERSIPSTRR
jgi:hypothetical protein